MSSCQFDYKKLYIASIHKYVLWALINHNRLGLGIKRITIEKK